MLSDFHFMSPEWFLALLPLGAILWGIGRRGAGAGDWKRVVDPSLLPYLLLQGGGRGRWLPLALIAGGWLAAVVALANPTFERLPVPAYRGELARVVVLDLSRSMEAADLEPSRLARARYKVADILKRSREGQVGLIAFAGDAFVVSPLTDDADTILAMLDAAVPEIMPVQGSRPDLALAKAAELLTQAGASRGEVVLVGDDAGGPRALAQAKALRAAGYSLSVIGVGTQEGAPVPGVRGADERPVIARLDADSMRALARSGGGVYAPLSADETDLDLVLRATATMPDQAHPEEQIQTQAWKELGPWVLLCILPLGALAFRRGWLLAMALLVAGWAWVPEPAMALGWDDLWQRRDQQASAALEAGEHEKARDLAEQPDRRGAASYRLGDYQAAARDFAAMDQADAHYNRGNALAKSGRLEEAVVAYDQALAKEPGMEDAVYNKALVEDLLRRQQQKQQSQGGGKRERQGEQAQGQQPEGKQGEDQSQADKSSGDQSHQGEQQDARADESDKAGQQEKSDDRQQTEGQKAEPAAGENQASGQEQAQEAEVEDESPQASGEQSAAGDSDRTEGSRDETSPAEAKSADDTERAAADYREQAASSEDRQGQEGSVPAAQEHGPDESSPEEREARQAADQWLRRIPDDPAGLLRRKFLYQYRSRSAPEGSAASGDPW